MNTEKVKKHVKEGERMEYKIVGDSHGPFMAGLIEGIPAGLTIDKEAIDADLRRRQKGYGRGERMHIESDEVNIVSGVWNGITTGAPLVLMIGNKAANPIDVKKERTVPRPGHGDYSAWTKYGLTDLNAYTERNSARWTTALAALGSVAKQFLTTFDVRVVGFVASIGKVRADDALFDELQKDFDAYIEKRNNSPVACPFEDISEDMIQEIENLAFKEATTLGGSTKTFATGVKPGLGSYSNVFNKVDSKIGRYFMSIPSVKGVHIGHEDVSCTGFEFQDPFTYENGRIKRTKNFAGGIEAGITNGENIVVTTYFKPISTLANPLNSIDLETKERCKAPYIRSDSVIVPAATVLTESVLAMILMEEIVDGFGNDNIELIRQRYFEKYSQMDL